MMNRTFSSTVQLSLFLCLSMCLGIGILRFSYTALLPSTREAYEWSHNFASLLGSANLLGYLIGAFWAMKLPQNAKMPIYIIFAALFGSISLFACAFAHFNEVWYLVWRIISGIGGGLLMILSPSIVAQCSELQHRFKINLIGFSGIGIGVLAATLFMPYLDRIAISSAWFILCGFAFVITLLLWILVHPFQKQLHSIPTSQPQTYTVNKIYYSLGSALGAATAYALARKFGNFLALKILYSVYIAAVFIAVLSFSPVFTLMSSFLTGLLNPAVVFLTSYTILQLYGLAYKKLWSMATLSFATVQLVGGLSFSTLQHLGWSYHFQFMLAAGVLGLGTLQLFYFTRRTSTSNPTTKKEAF